MIFATASVYSILMCNCTCAMYIEFTVGQSFVHSETVDFHPVIRTDTMVKVIKVFKVVKKNLAWLGICKCGEDEGSSRFKFRKLLSLLTMFLFAVSILYYMTEVERFSAEFTDSGLGMFVGFAIVGLFLTMISKTQQIFDTFEHFEKILEQRKSLKFNSNMCICIAHIE